MPLTTVSPVIRVTPRVEVFLVPDVPDNIIFTSLPLDSAGNPAKVVGWVNEKGDKLAFDSFGKILY